MGKKLFIVDTLVTFRNRYVIEADELEHAYDEVVMNGDKFEATAQKYLDETIIDGRKIKKKDFDQMLVEMKKTNEGSYWMGEKLIHKVNYDEGKTE